MALVYWIDRALGGHVVPDALEAAGVEVRRYASSYQASDVEDARWIPEIAALGWVIVTKDKNIRRHGDELHAIHRSRARYVCLSAGNLRGADQAAVLLEHWRTIDGFLASRSHQKAALILSVSRAEVHWLDGEAWRVVKHKR